MLRYMVCLPSVRVDPGIVPAHKGKKVGCDVVTWVRVMVYKEDGSFAGILWDLCAHKVIHGNIWVRRWWIKR